MRPSTVLASLAFVTLVVDSARTQVPRPETSTQIQRQFVLGRHLAGALEGRDGRINDQAMAAYVQGIANRLARATSGKAFEVRITQGSDQYAYLLPQGVLYISGGLLKRVETEAELAGLLAHQLAHMRGTMAPAQSQVTTSLPWPSCILSSRIAPTIWSQDRRQSELLATQAAVNLLSGTGYEPSAVLDLLSKLAYEHPAWAEAILPDDLINLRAIVETESLPQDGYKIDSSEFVRQHAKVEAALKPARSGN